MSDPCFVPTRLCCGQKHLGVVCPDNKVMCCYCFDRFTMEELASDEDGLIDVCQECWNREQEQLSGRIERGRDSG